MDKAVDKRLISRPVDVDGIGDMYGIIIPSDDMVNDATSTINITVHNFIRVIFQGMLINQAFPDLSRY